MLKVQNSEKYQKARDFRKRGFTYSEITKIVGVSKGTLSSWFAKKDFSQKVRQDNELRARRDNVKRIGILNKYRTLERQKRYQEAIKSAEVEYKHYKSSPLFMAGLMLYATVGDLQHPFQIRLPSQRGHIHKIFKRFLMEFVGTDKQKIYSTNEVTILNDALTKKKLVTWIKIFSKHVHK